MLLNPWSHFRLIKEKPLLWWITFEYKPNLSLLLSINFSSSSSSSSSLNLYLDFWENFRDKEIKNERNPSFWSWGATASLPTVEFIFNSDPSDLLLILRSRERHSFIAVGEIGVRGLKVTVVLKYCIQGKKVWMC
jgi:hypothetical protein